VLSAPSGLAANITSATLTVRAVNTSRTYGLPNPPFVVSYSGFVNGENTNVLTGAPTLSSTATGSSPPGLYPIMVNVGTLSATNYSFSPFTGRLTVVALPQLSAGVLSGGQLVFTWPTIANQTYQFETTTDLIAAPWAPAGNPVVGTGNPVAVTNAIGNSPQQFFKLSITQ
jgi:MBG domain (YGX type)